ncbi:VWA domain-containing protein [bacterium AH-315-C07]|nr:VWA domain-containing protein [bacterium AH-315-C07]
MMLDNYTFESPYFFYLLLLVPVLILWYWKKNRTQFTELQVSDFKGLTETSSSWLNRIPHTLFIIRILSFIILIIALSRPQSTLKGKSVTTEGIDIVMAVDISGSMLAEDFKPNRIEAAKLVGAEFITGRPNDRIGLVIFSGESFTQCPLTTDHQVVKDLLTKVKSGMVEDGTAIGMGLATAVNRLKESDAKSKAIILLTDGVNNSGFIDPITAAEIAETFEIKVYTIGVGKRGMAPYPVKTPYGTQYQNVEVQIDEETLQKIASMTGGEYFRATNNQALEQVYEQIDKLEKTKIEVKEFHRYSEEFYGFAMLGALLIFLEMIFRYTILRMVP